MSEQAVIAYLGPNLSCLCPAEIGEGLPCAKQAGSHELRTEAGFYSPPPTPSAIVSKIDVYCPSTSTFDKWEKTVCGNGTKTSLVPNMKNETWLARGSGVWDQLGWGEKMWVLYSYLGSTRLGKTSVDDPYGKNIEVLWLDFWGVQVDG